MKKTLIEAFIQAVAENTIYPSAAIAGAGAVEHYVSGHYSTMMFSIAAVGLVAGILANILKNMNERDKNDIERDRVRLEREIFEHNKTLGKIHEV